MYSLSPFKVHANIVATSTCVSKCMSSMHEKFRIAFLRNYDKDHKSTTELMKTLSLQQKLLVIRKF